MPHQGEIHMHSYARLICVAGFVLLASGCSTTFKAVPLDASGRFPTQTPLVADAVKVNEPFDAKFKPLLYVKFENKMTQEYETFVTTSFRNTKVFDKVVVKADLESLIIEKGLTGQVSNVSDLIGLNNLQKQIGPFLIVEFGAEWKQGYNYLGSLKAIDPATAKTQLLLEQPAFNMSGLDGPLFYPLLNGFIEWTRGQPITVGKPAPTPKQKQKKN
jgi:hypothetical protein